MADAVFLMRHYCTYAGAAAAPPVQQQQRQQEKAQEEHQAQGKMQKTNLSTLISSIFRRGSPLSLVPCSASEGAKLTKEMRGRIVAAEELPSRRPASSVSARRWSVAARRFSVSALLQLFFLLWFSPLPSPDEFPKSAVPVSAAPWPAAAASPTALPLLLLLTPLAAAAPKKTTPEGPSTTEQASAAVKTRWGMWRQRLNAPESARIPPDGAVGPPAARIAAAKAAKRRGISPSSKSKAESLFYSVPLQLAGSTLLLSGATLSGEVIRRPTPEQVGTSAVPDALGKAQGPTPNEVIAAVFPVVRHTSSAATGEGETDAGAAAGGRVSARRVAPAAGSAVVSSSSRRIALSLRAPPAASVEAESDEEQPLFLPVLGGGGLQTAPAGVLPARRPSVSPQQPEAVTDGAANPTVPRLPPSADTLLYNVAGSGGVRISEAALVDEAQPEVPPHDSNRRSSQQRPRRPSAPFFGAKQAGSETDLHTAAPADADISDAVILVAATPDASPEVGVKQLGRAASYGQPAHVAKEDVVKQSGATAESRGAGAKKQRQQSGQPGVGGRTQPAFGFAEWRRRLQQRHSATGVNVDVQVTGGGGLLEAAAAAAKQKEAEELFGPGTTVQLLRTRRDFEAFVRQEVVQQERVAVILFFGRHCPYCMMYKGLYAEAARTVPAAIGGRNTVFAAKEVTVSEDDFLDDEEEAGSNPQIRVIPEPIENTLGVTHIPQIRVIAPVHLARQRQVIPARSRRGSNGTEGEAAADRGIIAAASGAATDEGESEDAGERGPPRIYWLPPLRRRSDLRAGVDQASRAVGAPSPTAATPYWTVRLGQGDFTPEGIYKYLIEHLIFDAPPAGAAAGAGDGRRRTGAAEAVNAAAVTPAGPPLTSAGSHSSWISVARASDNHVRFRSSTTEPA